MYLDPPSSCVDRNDPLAVFALVVLLATIFAGCADDGTPRGVYGVALSPRDPDAGFARFWGEAGQVGSVILWAGPIDEVREPQGGARVVAMLNAETGFQTGIMTSPFDIAAQHAVTTDRYMRDLANLVRDHPVHYLALGVEVDALAARDPNGYAVFVDWWAEAYTMIKAASSETLIFPVFQYERMLGLGGGLDDAVPSDPKWHLLDDFPARDVTAFTTFPGLFYRNAEDIPADHYAPLRTLDGPIGFTEMGWHVGNRPVGWASDEAQQARFVDRFFRLAPPHTFAFWLHLYDVEGQPPFDSMGMVRPDGTPRLAMGMWQKHTR